MSSRKERLKGDAAVAATAGATFGAPISIRDAEERVRPRLVARNQAKQSQLRGQLTKAPAPRKVQGVARGRGGDYKNTKFASGETKAAKAKRIAANRKTHGDIKNLQRSAKTLSKPLYRNQSKLWGASMAAGIPATLAAGRYREKKKSDARRFSKSDERKFKRSDAGVLGGIAGGAAYQGSSLALKPYEQRKYESKIKADPKLKEKQAAHRAATMPKNVPTGHKSWRTYSRTYPKDLPGAKMRRIQARTHAGRSGTLATIGAAALGAHAATSAYDSKKEKKVKKSHDPFGIAKARPMSDRELRHRKKIQGHVSQATGGLGLAALGGTLLATKKGGAATKGAFKAIGRERPAALKPKNLKSKTAPVLATSAGIGGLGSFNFAAYTNAESKRRNVRKSGESAFGVIHE